MKRIGADVDYVDISGDRAFLVKTVNANQNNNQSQSYYNPFNSLLMNQSKKWIIIILSPQIVIKKAIQKWISLTMFHIRNILNIN